MNQMEELLQKATQMRNESANTEQQLEFVAQQISSLENFLADLNFFLKNKEKKVFSPLGRGVFLEGEIDTESKLLVDVGSGVFIKKSLKETAEIIESQIRKFKEFRIQLETQLQEFITNFYEMLQQVEKIKSNN